VKDEILFWAADIRDEYIVEAAEKKPAENERKMLEKRYAGLICDKQQSRKTGRLETHRKGGRVMMYFGYGLGAAAVMFSVFIGGTVWNHSKEAPEKEPVSLSQTEPRILIEETERLVIATDEQGLLIFDCYGELTDCIENARLYPQNEKEYYWDAWVVSEEMPLPVALNGEETMKAGIYSLAEEDWMIEPREHAVNLLSESVWTTSEGVEGRLMNMENEAVTTIQDVFTRNGDFIVSASSIHNLKGKKLSQWSPLHLIIDRWDDKILRYDQQLCYYYLMDMEGMRWQAGKGMKFESRCGDLLNWTDVYGKGVITDINLETVMDEAEFENINSDVYLDGNELEVIAKQEDNGLKLVQKGSYYFVCDEAFRVQEQYLVQDVWLDTMNRKTDEYADEILYQNWDAYANEDEAVEWKWTWCLNDEGRLLVKELLKMDTYAIDTEGKLPGVVRVEREDNIALICCSYDEADEAYYLSTDGYSVESLEDGFDYELTALPGGVVLVESVTESGDVGAQWYFTEDGIRLTVDETREVLAVTPELQCVKDESGIYVGDYDGVLYQLKME